MANSRIEQLDDTFYALSDPTRRAIVLRLLQDDATVGELSEPFNLSASAMTKHLRVLERVGLIEQHREGRLRRCHLIARPLEEAAKFFDRYEAFWDKQLDNFAEYAERHEDRS